MNRALGRFLLDGAVNLARGWQSAALAVATIAAAVFVLGVALVASRAVGESLARWEQAGELSVFLADDITDEARQAVASVLAQSAAVTEATYLSADEASEAFVRAFPEFRGLVGSFAASPLPPTFEVRLSTLADAEHDVDALVDALERLDGVDDVRYDRALIGRVSRVVSAGRWVLFVLAGLLAGAATLAVLSVVRLSYVDRRDEVEILALVGAPVSSIRGPFVAEGWLQGTAGAGLALAVLWLGVRVVRARWGAAIGAALGVDPLPFLSAGMAVSIVAAAGIVGAIAGRLAVGKRALRLP
jgi:cell division transport system permease protein